MKLAVFFLTFAAYSQTTSVRPYPVVIATGQAAVSITPDQGRISVSAVTQAVTAQDAASQNATLANNIIAQLKQALGSAGTVQTVSYSIYPAYNNTGTLTGYSVNNTVEIVLNDLAQVGSIIDITTQAGASRINSLQFTLKDDSAARAQALKAATAKAKSKADAMATSLGLKSGAVLLVQESGSVVPAAYTAIAGAVPTTPILSGQLTVEASVTIQVELLQ